MHSAGNDPSPSGLVARREACAVVAMEIFVEENVVVPVRILLELPGSPVDRPPAIRAQAAVFFARIILHDISRP
jgi:hypothetical protein